MKQPKFCQECGTPVTRAMRGGRERAVCPNCDFTYWDNPTPVVAAVIEYQDAVVLVRSIGWPAHFYGLVTGFLEKGEMPEQGVVREVKEEVGLEVKSVNYIGMYPFYRMNQLLIAYHIEAEGTITLDTTELEDYKVVPLEKVRPWPAGTGYALNDWLKTKGYEPEFLQFPKRRRE